ncbi:PhoU domain-containing protein [Candidatus Amarolinea dominans]|uniref:phosphate signaling complex PhoU family protein n=1 Tax=Candidatus Amarolinea dominans TaxID=3140696 RepID=UPI0031CC5386
MPCKRRWRDLRRILAALTIASELERMGDHAKKIANIRLKSPQVAHLPMVPEVVAMGKPVIHLLSLALTAFASLDVQAVRNITAGEDEIDNRYRTIMNLLYAHHRSSRRGRGGDEPATGGAQTGANWRSRHQYRRAGVLRG